MAGPSAIAARFGVRAPVRRPPMTLMLRPRSTRKASMSAFPILRAASPILLVATLGFSPAFAADKPATPEQAASLQAFFLSLLPAPAPADPPFVTVQAQGPAYVVSFDLRAVNGWLKAANADVAYDPALIVYKLFEQNDGK